MADLNHAEITLTAQMEIFRYKSKTENILLPGYWNVGGEMVYSPKILDITLNRPENVGLESKGVKPWTWTVNVSGTPYYFWNEVRDAQESYWILNCPDTGERFQFVSAVRAIRSISLISY